MSHTKHVGLNVGPWAAILRSLTQKEIQIPRPVDKI